MSKSVYSLVLMDRLVEEVDRLAYAHGTSRSNMINQLLAESLSFTTPEKRMSDIFSHLENAIRMIDGFKLNLQQGDSMLSLQSSLRYKYNPTIRYQLALYRDQSDAFGELRVFFRTKSPALLEHLTRFYLEWARLEKTILGKNIAYEISPGRFVRKLYTSELSANAETLADACAKYITLFDSSLKLFFDDPQNIRLIANRYAEYRRRNPLIY